LGAASAGGVGDYLQLLDGEKPIPQIAGLIRGGKMPAPMRPVVAKLMEARGQREVARQIRSMNAGSAEKYFRLVEARNRYQAEFTRRLDEGKFDAVICPPVALPAFTHGSSEHLFPAVAYAFIYNVLGTPAGVVSITRVREGEDTARETTKDMADITAAQVEAGSAGLPLGVQVIARHWDDRVVLAVMAALERHFRELPDYPRLPME
jgi:fatty acid amide hydrolase